ncbi:MAG TPA: DNA-processing protein DprA [Gemmatimonadaceae bacterium]|nr:DNA-processing protein DprA [Gemmatimonadaceae bacterium]
MAHQAQVDSEVVAGRSVAVDDHGGRRVECWDQQSPTYPPELLDLAQPPVELFVLGRASALAKPRVAIVGTRNSTAYGERVTRTLTRALTRAGASIVSGMARGIDAAAHRTALECGGNTVAVLGTGIDVPYPVGHRVLHQTIADHGLVVSENPPGARAHQGAFPRRNRIIAALAPVTIVVEAGFRSGALNTAGQALELNRTVAAVPGPIDSDQSRGSNQLLRDGAVLIAAPDDALTLLGLTAPPDPAPPLLPDSEQKVWDATSSSYVLTDSLPAITGLTMAECLAAITSLEILGLVECSLAGEIRRR